MQDEVFNELWQSLALKGSGTQLRFPEIQRPYTRSKPVLAPIGAPQRRFQEVPNGKTWSTAVKSRANPRPFVAEIRRATTRLPRRRVFFRDTETLAARAEWTVLPSALRATNTRGGVKNLVGRVVRPRDAGSRIRWKILLEDESLAARLRGSTDPDKSCRQQYLQVTTKNRPYWADYASL